MGWNASAFTGYSVPSGLCFPMALKCVTYNEWGPNPEPFYTCSGLGPISGRATKAQARPETLFGPNYKFATRLKLGLFKAQPKFFKLNTWSSDSLNPLVSPTNKRTLRCSTKKFAIVKTLELEHIKTDTRKVVAKCQSEKCRRGGRASFIRGQKILNQEIL